ncbi:MAG: hypothetical protein HY429_01080 [Candidatus Levybacteria bacterium]|nr:hypothetical protein [Candidatus Levybacteria bacterium]
MKKIFFVFLVSYFLFLFFADKANAAYDPLAVPNNKVGIHILFPQEINDAAALVNENGDWGYVTIPIQAGDKDLEKWQKFMDSAKQNHVIPIVRIATEGDYFNTKVWRQPTASDVLDFANFLNSLIWPVENQYVVIFNEVNRADEWGGSVNPEAYADLLEYATIVFKNKSKDFFILAAGLDNAAATVKEESMDQYAFMQSVENAVPGVFSHIDGIASHSYPNPGFSQPPSKLTPQSIASFKYEKALAEEFAKKPLPIFITETGWRSDVLPHEIIGSHYRQAFESVWNEPSIVAITPFLLRAGDGTFRFFSFIDDSGQKTQAYDTIHNLVKSQGLPIISKDPRILGTKTHTAIIEKQFTQASLTSHNTEEIPSAVKQLVKWLLKL